MTFRSVLKTVAKVFLGLLSLAALLLAWAMFVNRHDEPLTPEAQAILSYRAEAVPDAENGYVAMVGFTAPAGSDWIRAGADGVARYNEQSRIFGRTPNMNVDVPPIMEEARKLKFSENECGEQLLKLSLKDDEDVLRASLRSLSKKREQLDCLLAANAELIRRYETILAMPAFSETVLFSSALLLPVDYPDIMAVRRLLLARAALLALSGDRESLLDFLERDLRFWRMAMRGDAVIITVVVNHVHISEDLRLLRALLPQIELSASEAERLRRLLVPLSVEERSFLRTLKNEWNWGAETMLHTKEIVASGGARLLPSSDEYGSGAFWQEFLVKWFFQPQATLNFYVENLRPWNELAHQSPPEFAARRAAMNAREGAAEAWTIPWAPYNFTGRMLIEIKKSDYGEYIGRRYDIAAMLQLTRAQLELQLAGIDAGKNPQAVPEFLAGAGEETRNPYTGASFDWNEACRRLSFVPQGMNRRAFSEVTLADVPEQNAAACAASATVSPISRH